MVQTLCLCAEVPRLPIDSRVVILMHHRELPLTTNTAALAKLVIPQCEIRIRGLVDQPLETQGILSADRQPLFLYPSEEAVEVTPEWVARFSQSFTLIVPDGSWKQARKVARREEILKGVPHIKIRPTSPSRYRLRQEPDAESLCTYEAIMMALEILEGSRGPEIARGMDQLFIKMVERTLWSRGVLPVEKCTYSIPPDAIQVSHIAGARGGAKSRALRLKIPLPATES